MKYTQKSIKEHKGRKVCLRYKTKIAENTLVGEIIADTKEHIVFKQNDVGPETFLTYGKIMNIDKPKSKLMKKIKKRKNYENPKNVEREIDREAEEFYNRVL
jgi:hypothetical protein